MLMVKDIKMEDKRMGGWEDFLKRG